MILLVALSRQGKIVSSYFKSFSSTIPEEICRFAVLGVVASLLATAVIYSRREHVTDEITAESTNHKFQQPKDRQQAEGWFIPAPKSEDVFEQKVAESLIVPVPRPRPNTPGFYYELVRAQGDAEEGEYELIEHKCIPKRDMPKPCYLPERVRRNFPVRRQ